jgi:UDP-N-acetylglucosamine diphosphorylase/glucosamine-1-phosphate N-acetyltransferase
MSIILFDNINRSRLFPLALTRAIADIRAGIFTIKEWWQHAVQQQVFVKAAPYLQNLYEPLPQGYQLFVDATVLCDDGLLQKIQSLKPDQALVDDNGLVAVHTNLAQFAEEDFARYESLTLPPVKRLEYVWQLFRYNEALIKRDFTLITKGRQSAGADAHSILINPENIFIEPDARVSCSIINATTGPVYIGKDAEIMEGSTIRGALAVCNNAVVKMGSRIYGATTIGPFCTVGGEVKNSILTGYSNKGHDGYLGDSVIGEWCNMGAGTSNSNVKNTGSDVKLFNYHTGKLENVGPKCGLIMGDYTRTAINTAFNTGTVVGICCNVFGDGLSPKVLDNFTWGFKGLTRYELEKALQDIANWKKMKGRELSAHERKILQYLFDQP